ncbi:hypothetical protein T02_9113 [Trichinella nativa]|uniref:Uncharacterized protein n=1 Tax=Trichinella nativa TaxID=6335 RepID=A0A0V1LJ90_9BILA|nr:hypothetical protein T02_9113 [Trichinella nativa]
MIAYVACLASLYCRYRHHHSDDHPLTGYFFKKNSLFITQIIGEIAFQPRTDANDKYYCATGRQCVPIFSASGFSLLCWDEMTRNSSTLNHITLNFTYYYLKEKTGQ